MKKNSRSRHTRLLRSCCLGILLVLLAIALVPNPAAAVPHKESTGPLMGDPDGPDQSPSPGPAKAGAAIYRSSSVTESFTQTDIAERKASRANWLLVRAIEFLAILRTTLGK